MSKRWLPYSIVLPILSLIIFASLGCGSSGTANLRILHAAPNEPQVNVLLDGTTVNSNLAYSANTGYISASAGSRHLQIEPVNSSTPIVDTTVNLGSSTNTTVIVAGVSAIQGIVLADQTTAPAAGSAVIRVVNAAPSMGSADIYLVPDGTSIAGTSPLISGLSFESASSYQTLTIAAGTTTSYDLYFTEPGTTLALLRVGPISIGSGTAFTVMSLNGLGGGFTSQVLGDLD